MNEYFDSAIINVSTFTTPLKEAALHFKGKIIARAFARFGEETFFETLRDGGETDLIGELLALGTRFIFAQAYDNLVELEPTAFQERARTVVLPLPPGIYTHSNTWAGSGTAAICMCASIQSTGYARAIYDAFRENFEGIPYRIFGWQTDTLNDPNILPYLSDNELISLFARAPVFIYPYVERRQIHYSPVEAMVVGTPVLYRRNTLIDRLLDIPNHLGACDTFAEMRKKAERLLSGDAAFAYAIRSSQETLIQKFSSELALRQWSDVLGATQ